MNFDASGRQVARQSGRTVGSDDFSVGSHDGNLSTFCANFKHNLSLDHSANHPQVPGMHIGDRIARARTDKGWSQAKLGAEINAAQTTISSWERNRTEPSRDDVERVAAALGVALADIEGTSSQDGTTVPVVGYVQAGGEAVLHAAGQGPFDYVTAPEGSTRSTVAAEIRGTSLGPFFETWLVFWNDVRSPVTQDLHNQVCVVGLPDGRILVKQIKPSRTPGLFHLMSQTEGPMLDQEIDWAALVTGMQPRR